MPSGAALVGEGRVAKRELTEGLLGLCNVANRASSYVAGSRSRTG